MQYNIKTQLLIITSLNIALILVRIFFTVDFLFLFLVWNLFLAVIPLIISNHLINKKHKSKFSTYSLLLIWFIFFPNATYLVTDLVHLKTRPPVPFWYDIILLSYTAIIGLLMAYLSLMQTEKVLLRLGCKKYINLLRALIIFGMSYGVYIGRYLRFNSWDLFIQPHKVLLEILDNTHLQSIGFIAIFGITNFVLYSFLSSLSSAKIHDINSNK